jgi:hypothetical protein
MGRVGGARQRLRASSPDLFAGRFRRALAACPASWVRRLRPVLLLPLILLLLLGLPLLLVLNSAVDRGIAWLGGTPNHAGLGMDPSADTLGDALANRSGYSRVARGVLHDCSPSGSP